MKIISVKPSEEYFSLTWRLGIRCNYDCMYCSSEWHDNTSVHHSLETLQNAWQDIFNKTKHRNLKYKISFAGGEVTSSKHFLPFIKWLRDNFKEHLFQILLTTNGSANYTYYSKLYEYVDNISFSTHSEHINEQEFFDMILKLHANIDKKKFIHVNIMNEFWNRDRIPHYKKILDNAGISNNINEINYTHQTRRIPILKGKLNLEI